MNPARFVVGELVRYVNHVTREDLGLLEVTGVSDGYVFAGRVFDKSKTFKFHSGGCATWSSNLSIAHASH